MDKFSLLAISDIHFGCPRINPKGLHEKLRKYLYPKIEGSNILFICGDFLDTQLSLNSYAAFEAMDTIREIKEICKKMNCDLRVLRGTLTHDRNQPRHFINGEDADSTWIRLYETLSVEHHDKTGLDILYIPDNLRSENIYDDIRNLLESHGLDHVDVMAHHGYFKHMLPEALINKGLPNGCLEYEKIKKFVWGCTLNGHVHISSVYNNVISIGSFDRLAHGEEEPKGLYRIDIEKNTMHLITGENCDVYKFLFIENVDANKFLTINLIPYDPQESMDRFTQLWIRTSEKLHDNEQLRIRILSNDKSVIEGCAQFAKERYDNVLIDQSSVVRRDQTITNEATDLSELPVISKENLEELVVPLIKKSHPNVTRQDVHEVLTSVGCTTDEGVKDDSNSNAETK